MRKFLGWLSLASFVAMFILGYFYPSATHAWVWYDYVGNFLIWIWEGFSLATFVGMILDDSSWLSLNTTTNWIGFWSWVLVILVAFLAIALGATSSGIVYPWFHNLVFNYIILGWPTIMVADVFMKPLKSERTLDRDLD